MVNIVVVCWNALEYTKNTLNSLLKSIDDSFKNSVRLTLINNGSSDGTLQYLKHFTKTSFLKFLQFLMKRKHTGKNIGKIK